MNEENFDHPDSNSSGRPVVDDFSFHCDYSHPDASSLPTLVGCNYQHPTEPILKSHPSRGLGFILVSIIEVLVRKILTFNLVKPSHRSSCF